MGYRVKLQWSVITKLPSDSINFLNDSCILFNFKGGKSFLRSIGGKIRCSYEPVTLEATDIFHADLKKSKEELGFSGKKFPYALDDFLPGISTRLNVNFHLFGNVLCSNYILDEIDVADDVDLSQLQRIENHPQIKNLILKIAGIFKEGKRHAHSVPSLPKYYPAIRIVSLKKDAESWRSDMATLVARHPQMRNEVVSAVLSKNDPHQVDESLILVDKQGILAYVPFTAPLTAAGNFQRFKNMASMLEFAAVIKLQMSMGENLPKDIIKIITNPDQAISNSVSSQKSWILLNSEFKLQDELNYLEPQEDSEIMRKILIVTVTQVESMSVKTAFQEETTEKSKRKVVDGHVYQELGTIDNSQCFLCISEMGTAGLSGSIVTVQQGIKDLQPDAVIMVGIAFGIDKSKFTIGDILVSQQLQLYDLQRVNNNNSLGLRGDKPQASRRPLNWARHAQLDWDADNPKVEIGLILSGDKLIDNHDYRETLSKLVPEAIGGEMEAAGLYVACQNAQVDWIMIKAICDWADGNKAKKKKANQTKAARNAAQFAIHLIKVSSDV